jgi:hypothetical protein
MNLSLEDLQRGGSDRLSRKTLEKALRLLRLLDALRSRPFLRTRVALQGGTALNLFVFDVPRLSVDVDRNYAGGIDREVMLVERPKVEPHRLDRSRLRRSAYHRRLHRAR